MLDQVNTPGETEPGGNETVQHAPFWKRFLWLYLLGLVGIVGLVPVLLGQYAVLLTRDPAAPPLPLPVLAAASLIQPAVLLAVAVAVGLALAPRLGLRSQVVDAADGGPTWDRLRRALPLALLVGALGAVGIVGLDILFGPFMPPLVGSAAEQTTRSLGLTVSGMLYGGITEELLLRWGLMTLLAWLGWRLAQRGQGTPSAAVMWAGIVLAAVLFGAGHLPAAGMLFASLTPVLIVRTILLNALLGVFLGWLYWRRSLEAAMVAHGMAHIVMTLLSLVFNRMI